jgi:predicted nucleic acid-binding protein
VAFPDLADVETLAVVRKRWLAGKLTAERCAEALQDLAALPFPRFPASGLLERAFELRHNVSAYDGMYVALAEQLDATLLTSDARLSRAHGIRCKVRLFPP